MMLRDDGQPPRIRDRRAIGNLALLALAPVVWRDGYRARSPGPAQLAGGLVHAAHDRRRVDSDGAGSGAVVCVARYVSLALGPDAGKALGPMDRLSLCWFGNLHRPAAPERILPRGPLAEIGRAHV